MMGGCTEANENKFSILCVDIYISPGLQEIALKIQREAHFHPLTSSAHCVVLTLQVLVTSSISCVLRLAPLPPPPHPAFVVSRLAAK